MAVLSGLSFAPPDLVLLRCVRSRSSFLFPLEYLFVSHNHAHLSAILPKTRYQFKVERWTTVGGSTIAAFASRDEGDAQILHDIIHCILETCPQKFERSEC